MRKDAIDAIIRFQCIRNNEVSFREKLVAYE